MAAQPANSTQRNGDARSDTHGNAHGGTRGGARRSLMSHVTPALGKAVRAVAKLRGGGSALPGKVVESVDPDFMARTLEQLPLGVMLVSGTNGKTTTTRMIAKTLENLGLKVFTNPTGSNFTRGVVSALIPLVDSAGRIDADIAVLELDEAYAVHFVRKVKPRYAVLLNVMRDQLDRFGEIDNTANLLAHVAEATTGTLVLNREDRRIAALAQRTHAGTVQYFGLEAKLRSSFPTDDELHTQSNSGSDEHGAAVESVDSAGSLGSDVAAPTPAAPQSGASPSATHPLDAAEIMTRVENDSAAAARTAASASADAAAQASVADAEKAAPRSAEDFRTLPADVTLVGVHEHSADFILDGQNHSTSVRVSGIYNLFNAAAALSVVRAVIATAGTLPSHQALANTTSEQLLEALSTVTPAFGRGENIDVNGTEVELVLVKNPAGFRLALTSFDAQSADTMIAINDDYADGRDMSWLWDVDFGSLKARGVTMVSGVRSWDMALRLGYDDVAVAKVEPDLAQAVDAFVELNPGVHKRIYCTYTAMLGIRKHLAQLTTVSDVGV